MQSLFLRRGRAGRALLSGRDHVGLEQRALQEDVVVTQRLATNVTVLGGLPQM